MSITPLAGLTEKQLDERLYQYRNILSESILNYMCSMISLDKSVLSSSDISKEEMELLMQLRLYQDITRYNIYQRALMVAKKYEQQGIVTIEPTDNTQELKVAGKLEIGDNPPFFQYKCVGEADKSNTHSINLYQFKIDPNKRKEEKDSIYEKLYKLYAERDHLEMFKTFGAENYQLIVKNRNQISSLEKKIKKLEKYDSLTPQDIQMLQMQESFCEEILKDYGIKNDDLLEERKPLPIGHGNRFTKRMIKTYPSITVTKNISYI